MPQYDIRCMVDEKKKLDNIGSSIIKCAIPIIYIHNLIRSKHQRDVSQKNKHDDIWISTKSQIPVQVGAVEDDL